MKKEFTYKCTKCGAIIVSNHKPEECIICYFKDQITKKSENRYEGTNE